MGVVEDLITGGDGIVQAVTLCTATGLTNQPVTRLTSYIPALELNLTTTTENRRRSMDRYCHLS